VLRHLQRTLDAGKPQAISNKQIQTAIHFGSEGEVSQIMRWLAGEQPTMGRWAYGCLNANPQQYRFITRERMPSGGYLVTLLANPERIDAPRLALPQIVQLSFFGETNDPSVIPRAGQQDAPQGGSFLHDPFDRADQAQRDAPNAGSQRDQHEERSHESNSSSVGARPKYDWSGVAISWVGFLPTTALEKSGVTPEIFQSADRKILTRTEYDRPTQVRILIRSLLSGEPIYSAAEITAREQEPSRERPAESAPRRDAGDHGANRTGRSHRRENRQQPRTAAQRFSRESYRRGPDA
jgi:hypothetical protein